MGVGEAGEVLELVEAALNAVAEFAGQRIGRDWGLSRARGEYDGFGSDRVQMDHDDLEGFAKRRATIRPSNSQAF